MVAKIKKSLDTALMAVLSVLVFLILVCVVWQVFSRYVMKAPAIFTEEIVRFFMVWMGLLGAAYGFGSGKHLALTLLFDKLQGAAKLYVSLFLILLTSLMAASILVYGGVSLMVVAQGQVSSVLGIPMQYIYLVLPLSGICTLIYQACIFIELISPKESQ